MLPYTGTCMYVWVWGICRAYVYVGHEQWGHSCCMYAVYSTSPPVTVPWGSGHLHPLSPWAGASPWVTIFVLANINICMYVLHKLGSLGYWLAWAAGQEWASGKGPGCSLSPNQASNIFCCYICCFYGSLAETHRLCTVFANVNG